MDDETCPVHGRAICGGPLRDPSRDGMFYCCGCGDVDATACPQCPCAGCWRCRENAEMHADSPFCSPECAAESAVATVARALGARGE